MQTVTRTKPAHDQLVSKYLPALGVLTLVSPCVTWGCTVQGPPHAAAAAAAFAAAVVVTVTVTVAVAVTAAGLSAVVLDTV